MKHYLVTGWDSARHEVVHLEPKHYQEDAEHSASTWIETQAIGSYVEVLSDDGQGNIRHVMGYKRVLGGVVTLEQAHV